MARFALFLVLYGSASAVLSVCSAEGDKSAEVDSAVDEFQENSVITSYEEAIEEPARRRRREAPKTEKYNSQFIRSEKTTPGENIIWRDNSETRKQGHVPTVTKVLYHGTYPSLNVTVPLNGSYVGKYRQKRAAELEKRNTLDQHLKRSTATSIGTVSTVESHGSWQTERRGESETRSTNDNALEATQQHIPETRTPYHIQVSPDRKPIPGGEHYQKADHSQSIPYSSVDSPKRSDHAQGSIRYRTMYLPASTSAYQGDPENKGRVKLISVGYYSINETTADVRAYRNPKVDRSSHAISYTPRGKRDTHWAWLDKIFKSIGIMENPQTSGQENEIPGSEPLKLKVSEINEEAQDAYGYSSNGHGHPHNVDRIYLVQNDLIQNPHQPQKPNPNDPTISPRTTTTQPEEMPLPAEQTIQIGPVLIQAPPRKISCQPPKRLARGRCRTVW